MVSLGYSSLLRRGLGGWWKRGVKCHREASFSDLTAWASSGRADRSECVLCLGWLGIYPRLCPNERPGFLDQSGQIMIQGRKQAIFLF